MEWKFLLYSLKIFVFLKSGNMGTFQILNAIEIQVSSQRYMKKEEEEGRKNCWKEQLKILNPE